MALTGINRYVDTSATYNGDGTSPEQATSNGGTGAYNSLATALANAPASPSSESARWLIWMRRLNSETNISSSLSPTNDGSYNAPHMLIGFPFRTQQTGLTVDSVPTGTDNLGINKAKWQFVDSALTEGDNYWVGAEVEFTSGNNNGLKRKVIWFDASTDTVYLDFPLPNDIAANDQYTITLETEYYDDRPSAAQSLWDGDTNVTPVIDGGGGGFHLMNFSSDLFWEMAKFELQKVSSSYSLIAYAPKKSSFLKLHNAGKIFNSYPANRSSEIYGIYAWNILSNYGFSPSSYGLYDGKDVHINKGPSGTSSNGIYQPPAFRIKNITIGRVTSFAYGIKTNYGWGNFLEFENMMIDATTLTSIDINYSYIQPFPLITASGWQGESDKFRGWCISGEIYNLDEDATINPPSDATTYIKIKPSSYCNNNLPLIHEEERYQSSGSKTYTWKFRPTGWTGLTISDIEVEAWYLDESSGTHRTTSTANPTAVTNDTWNNLAITINPNQAGAVYFKIKLKRYESGAYIALDPKVDVS